MKDFLKLASKHTVIFSIGDMAQKAVAFLMLPVYMRCLSPEEYGVLAVLGILSMICGGIILQGLPTASFRAYSFDYGKDPSEQIEVINTAYTYLLICAFVFFAVLFIFAEHISAVLFTEGDFILFIRIVLVTEFFNVLINIPFVILRARLLSAIFAGISLARVFVGATLTIWLVVVKNMGVEGVLVANLIVSALMFLLAPVIPVIIHKRFGLRISLHKLKGMLAFGLPMVPGIFAAWIMSSADRYFLEHFSTRGMLGLYSIGFSFASILNFAFIQPFRKTWPAIFYPKAQEGDAQEVFSKFATYFLLVGCIGSLGIICAAQHLIQLFGPEEYWNAYSVVPVLVIGILFHGLQATINIGLFVKSKTKYAPVIVVIAALSNLLFNYFLVPRYGMHGAAVGTLLSYIVMLGLTFFINQKIYPVRYEYHRLFHLLVLFVLVVFMNQYVQIQSFWLSMVFKTLLFISFGLMLFLTRFFKRSELDFIKGVVRELSHAKKYERL